LSNDKLFHILRSQQFSREWLEQEFFPLTEKMKQAVLAGERLNDLSGKIVSLLFYEPSTRTRTSFQQAALKLGAQVVATENAKEFSSAVKGETMKDTTRIMNAYHFDAIIIRSDYEGAAEEAAEVSNCPIINAGDGAGQHPTQSLLDIYTIYEKFGKIDGLRVAFVGDLKYGRTVRSLSYLLGKFKDIKIDLVAPESLQMREDILEYYRKHGMEFNIYSDIAEIIDKSDVIYMTRAQKERMKEGENADGKGVVLNRELLDKVNENSIVMHPLPRSSDINEIPEELTDDPRMLIFKEAENGLFTRMALLKMVMG
jgi:aspartate carbamoyltransferase catalytic subunit